MCELEVTPILNAEVDYMSASQAELGSRAGAITWSNCLAFAAAHPIVTDANRQDIRDHFQDYGAWTEEEIAAWDDCELGAMVWQEAAAGMREFQDYCNSDMGKYQEECERGSISGRVYFSDDGNKAYLYLGV